MEQQHKNIWIFPLALAGVLALSGCEQAAQTQAQMPAPKVSVAEVIEQPINEWDEFTGRLEAPQSVEIRPRVSGYIDKVAFDEGTLVKKGDLLFQIDPRPFQAEVKRLEAQLQQARASQARAANEARRGERLRQSNAISAELADARASAATEAQAQVAAIAAELENARLNLSFTRITAPIDGRVSRAEITEGNLVGAGESLLTSVVSTDKVYAYFDAVVPARYTSVCPMKPTTRTWASWTFSTTRSTRVPAPFVAALCSTIRMAALPRACMPV